MPLCFTAITTLCVIVLIFFTTTSCNKSDGDELCFCINIDENVCGKVENASKFSNVVGVNLIWYGSDNKYSVIAHGDRKDDGFTITLPEILDPIYFNTLELEGRRINTTTSSTMTVSNLNVKGSTFSMFCGVNKEGNEVISFMPTAIEKDGTVKNIFFTYVDADVIISGYVVNVATVIPLPNYKGPDELTITAIFSIEWKKGWNIWWFSDTKPTKEGAVTRKYSTNPISKLKWRGK